jgi:RNA polymerase sigma-70 factor (ECF subfamily)
MSVDIESRRDEAQLAIFEASRSRLFSLAYRILGVHADAEDVVQDTFVKWHLQQRTGGIDALETPVAWLTTVAKRTAIDRLRRAAQDSRLIEEFEAYKAYEAYEAYEALEAFEASKQAPSAQALAEQTSDLSYGMRRVLERLSAEERVAFLLREAFEKDYASIARILDRSAVHCRQIVHRAKGRVRDDRRNNRPNAAPGADDAIEPLLDAIARQDVHALVALTLNAAPAAAEKTAPTATIASAHAAIAATLTHALIARLRLGRIDLPALTASVMA